VERAGCAVLACEQHERGPSSFSTGAMLRVYDDGLSQRREPIMIIYFMAGMFITVTVFNVIALARHWRVMRGLQNCLDGLIQTQRMFNELEVARRMPENERKATVDAILQRFLH
jgi:hypothetical protein